MYKRQVITELTDEQKAEFQKACAGIYDDYAQSVGQDVIDLFTGDVEKRQVYFHGHPGA